MKIPDCPLGIRCGPSFLTFYLSVNAVSQDVVSYDQGNGLLSFRLKCLVTLLMRVFWVAFHQ